MDETGLILERTRTVVTRLERISADSIWAHRSSGLRGSLLRNLERVENCCPPGQTRTVECFVAINQLELLILDGFFMLENAAREIRLPERLT